MYSSYFSVAHVISRFVNDGRVCSIYFLIKPKDDDIGGDAVLIVLVRHCCRLEREPKHQRDDGRQYRPECRKFSLNPTGPNIQ